MLSPSLYELFHLCTVRISILGKAGHGTGFFVAPGCILTCAHVVKAAQPNNNMVEAWWDGQPHSAQITHFEPASDLALLQIDLKNHPCVLFSQDDMPFDHLYSYGYPDNRPGGDSATFTLEGKADHQGGQLKFKAGEVRPGMSGAPILNVRTGRVCGVIRLTRGRASDLGGRAISARIVFQVFPELEIQQRVFHRQDQRWENCLWEYPVRTLQSRNRQRMLKKVRAFWITGVLEQSLHNAVFMLLGLSEQPQATENPWGLVIQEAGQSERKLSPGTTITQVYDQTNSELLILGEPGSGKTTLLLELARELLSRARENETSPIPVVFNLSSWGATRQPLVHWLIEELNTKYQVSHVLARSWLEEGQVLLLLDGLDEVDSAHRIACVEAINTYRREQSIVPMVVCSRQADYFALPIRLHLQGAVMVQPLSQDQVEAYLTNAGQQLAALQRALHDDLDLQTLASTPLMLNVLTIAYQGSPDQEVAQVGT